MMPIQVAAIIRDARYRGIKALYDPDIIDFMIYAQMVKPSINDDLIKSIEKSALRVNKIQDRNAEISLIDSYSIGKLTSALCRMNLNEKMTESIIYEATNIFEENYKQYIDLRKRSEEHQHRQSYNLDYAKSLNMRDRVTDRDQKVFNIIKDAREELGIEWISKTMIQERGEYGIGQDYDLMYSLQLLLNLGHIISRKNMNEFKNIHS
jgi:DNA replicative helicase MCM subunit Mcm2 (Cdc46/Mcm family)